MFLSWRSLVLVFLGLVTASSILGLMSGCARLLGIEDLPDSDRDGSVPPDAEPLEPADFRITGVEPSTILEGEGTAWAVPVVVSGEKFPSGATVVLNGAGFSQQQITPVVASDGNSLVFPVKVPVLPQTGKGETETITVTVRQGSVGATTQLTVTGLDELVISELSDTTLDADDFEPPYSRIVIDQDITLTGSDAIRLVATAEIRLEANVFADGANADRENPGPGGCAGGALQEAGGCVPGGGGGNDRDDGAGGGGHFTDGAPGGGSPTVPGGEETGRPELVPLADEAGNGGGGSSQGAGGGGGGIIELTSHGTFIVDGEGSISANGGRGGPGRCDNTVVGGSGGGGSGGAILVRAWGGFDDQDDQPRLSVRGGQGGDMPPDNDCLEVGGAGSFGRVRVDTSEPGGMPPFAQITPEPFQGPLLRNIGSGGAPVEVITAEQQITLGAFGDRVTDFTLDVNGQPQSFTTSSDRAASVTVTLNPGRNEICVLTGSNTSLEISEGAQCISIVSIQ